MNEYFHPGECVPSRPEQDVARLRAELERLRADNEKLTAALRVIANNTWTDMLGDTWVTQAAMVARRALEQGRKE